MTVHERIQVTKESDKTNLKEDCTNMIYSVLPSVYHGLNEEDMEEIERRLDDMETENGLKEQLETKMNYGSIST